MSDSIMKKILSIQVALVFIGALFLSAGTFVTQAQGAPPSETQQETGLASTPGEHVGERLFMTADFGGKYNPRILGLYLGLNYRDVYSYSEKDKAESTYWQIGASLGLTPAYGRIGAHFEVLPWIFLPLRVQYDVYRFFGTDYGLLSFNSGQSPYGDQVLDNRHDGERATAQRFMFQPTIQAKFDSVAFRNQTDFSYYYFSGKGPYFLEMDNDTLMQNEDYLIANRTQVLYEIEKGSHGRSLQAGPYFEICRAHDAQITQERLGGMIYWAPWEAIGSLERTGIILKLGYHLQDPNRQNQFYIELGMGFELNL
ncbi:MAG: hypothetical protein ABSB79_01200 [Syntrophales bacterium]|jgi:hypothetical protein